MSSRDYRKVSSIAPGVDPFSVEYHAELAKRGLRPKRKGLSALTARFLKALDDFGRAEEKLARAARKWDKARGKLRRLEAELARAQADADAAEQPEASS